MSDRPPSAFGPGRPGINAAVSADGKTVYNDLEAWASAKARRPIRLPTARTPEGEGALAGTPVAAVSIRVLP